jgi:hypothetical protein
VSSWTSISSKVSKVARANTLGKSPQLLRRHFRYHRGENLEVRVER